MKKIVTVIALAMALALVGSPLWAKNCEDHVYYAPNAVGDMLIYPVYVAFADGWETKICVVNTSPTHSTVAKVVIRGWIWSQELLDFFIYLSPNDVWCGTIKQDPKLGTILFSDDDSIQYAPGKFASAANPVIVPLNPIIDCADIEDIIGYVEVFENWAADLGIALPVPKPEILAAFENQAKWPVLEFPPLDILTGHYEQIAFGALTGANRAEVFATYRVNSKLELGVATAVGDSADNNICEVEAVLAKDQEFKYYYNSEEKFAIHWNTLPTKETTIDEDCYVTGVKGPFFKKYADKGALYCFEFTYRWYDLQENTPDPDNPIFSPFEEEPELKCFEVEPFFTAPPFITVFEEGWVRYGFGKYATSCSTQDKTAISYSGAPVIDTIWFIGPYGLAILPGAWDDGTVWCGDEKLVEAPFYKYTPSHL